MQNLKRKILIVDDELMLAELMADVLSGRDYEVVVVPSGNQAMRIIKMMNIDLIVSDIDMADGDGLSLLKNLRDQNFTIPVILMTGGSVTWEEALRNGAESLLLKPFNLGKLVESVRLVMAVPKAS